MNVEICRTYTEQAILREQVQKDRVQATSLLQRVWRRILSFRKARSFLQKNQCGFEIAILARDFPIEEEEHTMIMHVQLVEETTIQKKLSFSTILQRGHVQETCAFVHVLQKEKHNIDLEKWQIHIELNSKHGRSLGRVNAPFTLLVRSLNINFEINIKTIFVG